MRAIYLAIGVIALVIFTSTTSYAKTWAVWKHNASRPGAVVVAPLGSLASPWGVDSIWHQDTKGAWKKACWLVRTGDLLGRKYSSPDINTGRVFCDVNCNCRF